MRTHANETRFSGLKVLAILGALAFSLPPQAAYAGKFANQFVEFELPPQWQCNLEGAEWVCQSTNEQKKRDAIIVLAAKLKGDQDSLDQYLAYLQGAKSYTSVQGKPVKSEPKYSKMATLNSHPWVDSLHLESEIPGFYTRYLATIKEDIGVLVTYSINKVKYQQYLEDFESMVKTLKVFRKPGGINVAPANSNLFDTKIPTNISEGTIFPGAPIQGGSDVAPPKKQDDSSLWLMLLGGAVVLFIIIKKRRAGG